MVQQKALRRQPSKIDLEKWVYEFRPILLILVATPLTLMGTSTLLKMSGTLLGVSCLVTIGYRLRYRLLSRSRF